MESYFVEGGKGHDLTFPFPKLSRLYLGSGNSRALTSRRGPVRTNALVFDDSFMGPHKPTHCRPSPAGTICPIVNCC
jgi:hypothetical protein